MRPWHAIGEMSHMSRPSVSLTRASGRRKIFLRQIGCDIAGLRCHAMVAPWIIDAPMNRARFETYVETQLAPELEPGDVVIRDNVAFLKSERAAELVRQRGVWLLPLPPYSPISTQSRWRSQS